MLSSRSPVIIGGAARVLALGSQVGVLLIMSRMMPKSEFGNAMIAFTIYRLIGLAFGTGLGNLLLYRIVRAERISVDGIALFRTLALIGVGIGILLTLVALEVGGVVSILFNKPELEKWLVHMSPLLIFGILNQIGASFLDAKNMVSTSILKQEVAPNLLRLLGLFGILVSGISNIAAAHALWIALAIPWLDDLRILLTKGEGYFAPVSCADVRYCGWFTLQPIASQQLQGIDMLVVGALFSSATAADYSIASRIASFFPFFQYILLRNSVSAMGEALNRHDLTALARLMKLIRLRSNFYVISLISFAIFLAPVALKVFGDYLSALPVLILLAMPALVRTQFSGVDSFLKLVGRGDVSSLAAIGSAALLIVLPYYLAPIAGVYSIPLAMTIGALVLNSLMLIFARRCNFPNETRVHPILAVSIMLLLGFGAIVGTPWLSVLITSLPLAALSFLIYRDIEKAKMEESP